MQILNSVVLNKDLLNKNVRVGVIFNKTKSIVDAITTCTEYYEGVVTKIGTLGAESFIVLESGTMINLKYVQIIEVIK